VYRSGSDAARVEALPDLFTARATCCATSRSPSPRARSPVLLGRNGAGKTTTLRSIMGLTRPAEGRALQGPRHHRNTHRTRSSTRDRVRPRGPEIFPISKSARISASPSVPSRANAGWTRERIFTYFPVLQERWRQRGRSLSGGEQQMLAIARALGGQSRAAHAGRALARPGAPLVRELESLMVRLKAGGVTIPARWSRNARMALGVSDQVLVLGKARWSSRARPPSSAAGGRAERPLPVRFSSRNAFVYS